MLRDILRRPSILNYMESAHSSGNGASQFNRGQTCPWSRSSTESSSGFLGNQLYVQILTTLLFSMTVVLTYLIGKELWDEDTGITGGMLLLGMPYLLTQVPLMLADVPTMFFLTLAVFAFLRGLSYGGVMMAFASFSLFLLIFSKYSAWPMLSVMVVICLVYWNVRERASPSEKAPAGGNREPQVVRGKEVLWRCAWIFGTALLAAGMVVLSKYDAFREQFGLLMTFQAPGLKKWGESLVSTFCFQIHPFISLSALFSFYVAFRRRDPRYAVVSWLFILLFLFQVKRIRYTVPIFPMVALMASYGLQYIRNAETRRIVVLCAVLSSLTVGLSGYLPFLQNISAVNLKKAGEFVDGVKGQLIEVVVLPQREAVLNPAVTVPLLDLFTRKRIVYRYDPSDFLPHEEDVGKSPLRFTWEYENPDYYGNSGFGDRKVPVVVISTGKHEPPSESVRRKLEGYRLLREFNIYENVFQFRTAVSVYGHVSDANTPER